MASKAWLVAILVAFLLGGAVSWHYFTRGHDDEIERIQADADRAIAAAYKARAIAEDSARFWADSAARIRIDTVVIHEAAEAVERTGDTLEDYLVTGTDTVALRLWREHRLADIHLAELWELERESWTEQVAALSEVIRQKDSIIFVQDAELAAVNRAFASMRAEAERYRAKANPPFHVKLLRDGWKVAAGVGLGYLIAR